MDPQQYRLKETAARRSTCQSADSSIQQIRRSLQRQDSLLVARTKPNFLVHIGVAAGAEEMDVPLGNFHRQ